MFGFKRTKPQAFADVLDEISLPAPQTDETEVAVEEPITASQAQQPNDWLLQLLTGLVTKADKGEKLPATPPVFASSYLEDAVEPLLEAIASCEQDAIAEELGLNDDLSPAELRKLRRAFARANHPDSLDPSQRDLATHRMTIANMLIDRQLQHKSLAK